jgi:hypothetical protein
MSSATHSAMRAPGTKRPQGPREFPRAILVLAWVTFWLNTAFFPCCGAVAAAFGYHADSVWQTASQAQPAHAPGATPARLSGYGPYSPCGDIVSAGPQSVDAVAALTTEHSPQWFAIDAPVFPRPPAVNRSTNLAPREAPPAQLPLYLRELRLLL